MKKNTSIVLLSIISFIMTALLVLSFIKFPVSEVKSFASTLGAIELDNGMSESGVYTLTLEEKTNAPTEEELDGIMDKLSYRLDKLGYDNHYITAVKNVNSNVYDIRLEVNADLNKNGEPDYTTLDSVVGAAIEYGELKFLTGTSQDDVTKELFTELEGNPIKKAKSTGFVEEAGWGVSITFTDQAYAEMIALMEGEDQFYLQVNFGEGENETTLIGASLLSPDYFVDKSISFFTGSEAKAEQFVLQISTGGFEYEYKVSSFAQISTRLGSNVGLVSVIVICALMVAAIVGFIIFNKGFGYASSLSLIAFGLINSLMMILVPSIKLSIGGVIGMLLATVLAIDGAVLTSKRIREELATGKTVKSAIRAGFKRALKPILNGAVVSVILSLLLFAFTSAEIKLFAITFAIGSALALFTSLVLTRMFVAILLPLAKDKEKFLNATNEGGKYNEI